MATAPGQPGPTRSATKALAFYLPQFHPIPENDEWWGKGFTEWITVAKARPLFPGHDQPHIPGELGYYDLRVPEVREAQAELARHHGVTGFVYYHYWFHGKRLLERPFDEVLASGAPDFPFALCWANEAWTRNWDAQSGRVLMPQRFSAEDDLAHIRWLAQAFADHRYIKIDGRPLMLVYRPMLLPDPHRTTDRWRHEAQRLGLPDLYLAWVDSRGMPAGGPEAFGFDATVGFMPPVGKRLFLPAETVRGHRVLDYPSAFESLLREDPYPWKHFPSVMVGWDNTPRRPAGATIFEEATPRSYQRWLTKTVGSLADVREEENYLFILAWNEWAEGNHLEPDRRLGRAFLEATRTVLLPTGGVRPPPPPRIEHPPGEADGLRFDPSVEYSYPFIHDSAIANAAGLARSFIRDPEHVVVDLGAGTGVVSAAFGEDGPPYHALEVRPELVDMMKKAGIAASRCDLSDFDSLQKQLGELGDIGAFLVLDVLEHLTEPQDLLSTLSAWSLSHGEPVLVASVPNVAHFDLGLGLLCGSWTPTGRGLLDSTHLRFFTESTLTRLFESCGWRIVSRDDFHSIESDQYDPQLNDSLPAELISAVRHLSQTCNPNWATHQFVWVLAPVEVDRPPQSFYEAVGSPSGPSHKPISRGQQRALDDYLASIGLVANETNRRAVLLRQLPPPRWRRALHRLAASTSWSEAALRAVQRWLG